VLDLRKIKEQNQKMDERNANLWPRGLSRRLAADYIGISPTAFDELVKTKQMPAPKKPTGGRVVWDKQELDAAFDALPHKGEAPQHQNKLVWGAS
tara:strand:- start:894 stop:1178 length:285 start_codon:yes stop_codon:yes gene_type:complete